MPATIRQVVDDVLAYMGEVAGVSVQQYSEDLVFKHTVRAFNILFKKCYWSQYCKWVQTGLDGTYGIVTTDDLETVIDFEDFISIHLEGDPRPLPILPSSANPFTVTGTKARFWTSLHASDTNYRKKKLQFYPKIATDNLNIHARMYPLANTAGQEWDWEDTMHLDRSLLVFSTAHVSMIGSDLNGQAAETAKAMMNSRFADIMAGLARHPIPIEGATTVPNEWAVLGSGDTGVLRQAL